MIILTSFAPSPIAKVEWSGSYLNENDLYKELIDLRTHKSDYFLLLLWRDTTAKDRYASFANFYHFITEKRLD